MHQGQLVFSQLMRHLPLTTFRRCVARYAGEHKVKSFSCLDQYLCMAFAQLTYRESLRDIESSLRAQAAKLYHLGIRGNVSRNTSGQCQCDARLAYLRELRRAVDRHRARLVCRGTLRRGLGRDGLRARRDDDRSVSVGLPLGAVPIDEGGRQAAHAARSARQYSRALFISPTARCTTSTCSTCCCPEPGAYYVMDRGYLDFERLYHLHEAGSFFVTRAKSNLKAERRYSHPVDRATGLICDQTVILSGFYSHKGFPVPLRRIKYIDPKTHKRLVFLTNQFGLPALSIADLYRCRWQVELFFKWIKQHLRIKAFFGTSENAVKTQIWIAISVYVLVAIVKKRLNLPRSLYETLQILSLTLCEQMPLDELLAQIDTDQNPSEAHNQMNLFD